MRGSSDYPFNSVQFPQHDHTSACKESRTLDYRRKAGLEKTGRMSLKLSTPPCYFEIVTMNGYYETL